MTNKEFFEKKGTCIHTGDIGHIEAVIRYKCIIYGIHFDDSMIESWLEDIIPIYEKKGRMSAAEIIRLSIGDQFVRSEDFLHGFEKIDPRRIIERL